MTIYLDEKEGFHFFRARIVKFNGMNLMAEQGKKLFRQENK